MSQKTIKQKVSSKSKQTSLIDLDTATNNLINSLSQLNSVFLSNDSTLNLNNFNTVYVIQGDGVYLIKNLPIGQFRERIATCDIPLLPNVVSEGFALNVPKIPQEIFYKLLKLFRVVYNEKKTEVRANVYFSKANQNYFIYIPKQKVSSASTTEIDENELRLMELDNILVLEAHSHHNMSGKFSGIDDANQKNHVFHLVIGDIFDIIPSYEIRYVAPSGKFVYVNLQDVFLINQFDVDISDLDWQSKVIDNSSFTLITRESKYYDNYYLDDLFSYGSKTSKIENKQDGKAKYFSIYY